MVSNTFGRNDLGRANRERTVDVTVRVTTEPRPVPPADLGLPTTSVELDALPYGIIVVDMKGNVVEYNATEARATGFERDRVVGRNFFADVAPCTQVRAFQGRFQEFVSRNTVTIEPFEFVFPFVKGPDRVSILFYRDPKNAAKISIIVMRDAA